MFRELFKSVDIELISDESKPIPSADDTSIRLKMPGVYDTARILLSPNLSIGETYVEERWTVQPERLYDFLYLIRSQEKSKLQHWFVFLNYFHPFRDALKQRIFPIRSTRAVADHYNTNPSFMSLILGPSLSYTCAFFQEADASLEQAQDTKLDYIRQRISLKSGMTVLELGCGWGSSAFPLAERYQCRVTGITISNAQVEFCNARRSKSSARDRLRFLYADYVSYTPSSRFDRVVSLGMLEHVGKYQYTRFFDKIAEFLTDIGVALIHGMVEEEELSPDAWIDRYIFPGGYIPTISEVVAAIEESDCQLVALYTHDKANYFKTLQYWKSNLFRNRQQCENVLRDSGVAPDDVRTVIRIWEYFLSGSQIAFSPRYGRCRVAHFVVRRKE